MAAVSLSHIPAAHAACGAQSSSYRNEQDSTAYFTSAMPSRRTLAIKMERPASPAWNKSPHSAAVCRCMFDESILDPTMVIDAETKTPRKKTGAELREEFFLAAATGKERGLPEGAFLNDNVTDGPIVEILFEPYGDTFEAPEGSNLLKAAVDAGALKIDNRFCLTGQCDVCILEMEDGEVLRSCMKPVPKGRKSITCLVLDSDAAWDQMMV
eukprot:TRINITY_DN2531_c0_g1_i2.p1 TRINITY_DN2531_c0_g1~~TRINITY_DN2531_c0_g1_i2.p1  ORF type:complete len:222 (+),score=51.42 TRINITY_DN2531_c0_g1_i2:32-667(+)